MKVVVVQPIFHIACFTSRICAVGVVRLVLGGCTTNFSHCVFHVSNLCRWCCAVGVGRLYNQFFTLRVSRLEFVPLVLCGWWCYSVVRLYNQLVKGKTINKFHCCHCAHHQNLKRCL